MMTALRITAAPGGCRVELRGLGDTHATTPAGPVSVVRGDGCGPVTIRQAPCGRVEVERDGRVRTLRPGGVRMMAWGPERATVSAADGRWPARLVVLPAEVRALYMGGME